MGVVKKAIKAMFPSNKWNILRGDTVKILAGKDRGQTGTVTKVIRDNKIPRVIVEGLNLVSLCVKGKQVWQTNGLKLTESCERRTSGT